MLTFVSVELDRRSAASNVLDGDDVTCRLEFNRSSFLFSGVFAKCRYVYYGKHSEGNRFIRNDQL